MTEKASQESIEQRRLTEVDTLDALLHGGLPDGNSLLVQGGPGTGKTILGMQFLYGGIVRHGEPGMFVTFEETPRRLFRDARALGWDFESLEKERQLLVIYTSPAVFLKELEADTYSRLCQDYGFKRVVVDSLAHFETLPNNTDPVRVRFERIVNALRRDGLSALMIRELDTREPAVKVTPEEYLADTIIQLQYSLMGERRARQIEVLKHRGSAHSPAQHRFVIGTGGLQILASVETPG